MKQQNLFKITFWLFVFCGITTSVNAQLHYKTSWIGNTYGGNNNKWVQDFSSDIDVASDGTVVTNSTWDENGRCNGIYKDGDVAEKLLGEQREVGGCWCWGTAGKTVAVDKNYIYINNCDGDVILYDRNKNYNFVKENKIGFEADGMFLKDAKLYLVNGNAVQIRNKSDMVSVGGFSIKGASDIAVDKNNTIWLLIDDKIVHVAEDGTKLADTIKLEKPTAINIDNKGRLIVCESGWKRQVFFYNITATPVVEHVFGQEGGISAGTPGIIEPTKFFDLVAAGTDSLGNIYVAMSYRENIIRKFTPSGELVWELQALNFLDNVDAEVTSDGKYVYGSDEIYEIDYTKPAGQQWKLRAITRDKIKYPDDPREGNQSTTSAFYRNVDGHRLMFLAGQVSEGFYVYYFNPATDGEIAIPTGYKIGEDSWAKWVDKYGNVWSCNNGEKLLYKYPLAGFKASGEPIYGSKISAAMPSFFTQLQKIVYQADEDIMYLTGFTTANPDPGGAWGLAGTEITRFDNWSKSPELKYRTVMPFNTWEGGASHEMVMPKSVSVSGDYLFVSYVWNDGTSGANPPIHAYNNKTGIEAGIIRPGTEVGTTGWVDISFGSNSYQRTNGEYVVFLEDGSRAKNIMYQWCPTGDCMESDIVTNITSPSENAYFLPADILTINASATSAQTTIAKMHFYANDSLIGTDDAAPFEFTWSNRPKGLFALKAVAEGANGAKKRTIDGVPVTLGDGFPEITLLAPSSDKFYSVIDTISFKVEVKDNGTIDSVVYYLNDVAWATVKKAPYDTILVAPAAGTYKIKAKAYDNDLYSVETDIVVFQVYAYREPENPVSTKNGLIYRYYEGSYSKLPDFSTLTPRNIGIVQNFDISKRNVNDNFAFSFNGFIDIVEKGVYTFYTSSDDGSKLYLGNTQIVDNDGAHGPQERMGSVLLKPGKHAITVAFFEAGGGESVDVWYSGPGVAKTKIPDNVLYYEAPVVNTVPQVSITSPVENTLVKVDDMLPISVQLSDAENNLMKVEYYFGAILIGNGLAPDFDFLWKVNSTGNNVLTAKAIDFGDLSATSAPVNIIVDTKPTVSITSPANNAEFKLGDEIVIEASASDNSQIAKVEFYSTNTLLGTDTEAPYTYVMTSTALGNYKFKAIAFDDLDQKTESAIVKVKVLNSTNYIGSTKADKSIYVFPNPVHNSPLFISNTSKGLLFVSITDISGKLVYKTQTNEAQIIVPSEKLKNGVYILRCLNGSEVINSKVVVQ
jgi:hypothetical protein